MTYAVVFTRTIHEEFLTSGRAAEACTEVFSVREDSTMDLFSRMLHRYGAETASASVAEGRQRPPIVYCTSPLVSKIKRLMYIAASVGALTSSILFLVLPTEDVERYWRTRLAPNGGQSAGDPAGQAAAPVVAWKPLFWITVVAWGLLLTEGMLVAAKVLAMGPVPIICRAAGSIKDALERTSASSRLLSVAGGEKPPLPAASPAAHGQAKPKPCSAPANGTERVIAAELQWVTSDTAILHCSGSRLSIILKPRNPSRHVELEIRGGSEADEAEEAEIWNEEECEEEEEGDDYEEEKGEDDDEEEIEVGEYI